MDHTTRHLHISSQDNTIIIELLDHRIVDYTLIQSLSKELLQISDCAINHHLIIDFQNVENLSSTMISVLVALKAQMQTLGQQMRLTGLSKHLLSVFKLTRLNRILGIHADVESALASLAHGLAKSA